MVIDILSFLMVMVGLAAAESDHPLIPFVVALAGLLIVKVRSKNEIVRHK